MKAERIPPVIAGVIFALCLWSTCTSALFFCPPEYPADCGAMWCCVTAENCPRVGNLFIITRCTRKELCPATALYGEDAQEARLLREFRDEVLSQTPLGQEIISLYYQWSPLIIEAMDADGEFKEEVRYLTEMVLELIEKGDWEHILRSVF